MRQIAEYIVQNGCITNIELNNAKHDLFVKAVPIFGADKLNAEMQTISKYLFYGRQHKMAKKQHKQNRNRLLRKSLEHGRRSCSSRHRIYGLYYSADISLISKMDFEKNHTI
ncbi:hypothetical protein [Treponema denticola]|uniref:hypothetical protein n=1 Tax=Treponema denticola TaxID=158 RepID=UPI0021064EB2|nr:hypothetical protein [Treponema denticola]